VSGDEALCDGCTIAKVVKKDGAKVMTLASGLSLPLKAGTVLHVSTPYSTNECRHLRVGLGKTSALLLFISPRRMEGLIVLHDKGPLIMVSIRQIRSNTSVSLALS
jgi:hypothetical protein